MKTSIPFLIALALTVSVAHSVLAQAEDERSVQVRDAELRKHWDKFPLFPVEYDAAGIAPLRSVDPNKIFFIHDGWRYCGFRFRTPDSLPNGLHWLHFVNVVPGPVPDRKGAWYILRKDAPMGGFSNFDRDMLGEYPALKRKFPYTKSLYTQSLGRGSLEPDTEYLIWFGSEEDVAGPRFEYVFAISFPPEGAKRLNGSLPFYDRSGSYEGDPW